MLDLKAQLHTDQQLKKGDTNKSCTVLLREWLSYDSNSTLKTRDGWIYSRNLQTLQQLFNLKFPPGSTIWTIF